jgi:hypothetical protein
MVDLYFYRDPEAEGALPILIPRLQILTMLQRTRRLSRRRLALTRSDPPPSTLVSQVLEETGRFLEPPLDFQVPQQLQLPPVPDGMLLVMTGLLLRQLELAPNGVQPMPPSRNGKQIPQPRPLFALWSGNIFAEPKKKPSHCRLFGKKCGSRVFGLICALRGKDTLLLSSL